MRAHIVKRVGTGVLSSDGLETCHRCSFIVIFMLKLAYKSLVRDFDAAANPFWDHNHYIMYICMLVYWTVDIGLTFHIQQRIYTGLYNDDGDVSIQTIKKNKLNPNTKHPVQSIHLLCINKIK